MTLRNLTLAGLALAGAAALSGCDVDTVYVSGSVDSGRHYRPVYHHYTPPPRVIYHHSGYRPNYYWSGGHYRYHH